MRVLHDKKSIRDAVDELAECQDNPSVSIFVAGRHIRHRHAFSHACRLADDAYNIISHRHGRVMGYEFKNKIFEAFLSMSFKRELPPGDGLGLFISKSINLAMPLRELKRSFVMVAPHFHIKQLYQELLASKSSPSETFFKDFEGPHPGPHRLLIGLEDVAHALPKGNLRSLLLASNKILWGSCDVNTGTVERVMNPYDSKDGDLLNHLLLWARKTTTPVAIMDCAEMPEGSPVAAFVEDELQKPRAAA